MNVPQVLGSVLDARRSGSAIVWGTSALPGRTALATGWYRDLCAGRLGAAVELVRLPDA